MYCITHLRFQSTLPRGSDVVSCCGFGYLRISIHAPSRERLTRSLTAAGFQRFQSTLPRGSDLGKLQVPKVSRLFQSTLPRGSDMLARCPCGHQIKFQSTLPRGSDGVQYKRRSNNMDFNPRSLAGATYHLSGKNTLVRISIHAPSRERPYATKPPVWVPVFQSTLPRGSDEQNKPTDG